MLRADLAALERIKEERRLEELLNSTRAALPATVSDGDKGDVVVVAGVWELDAGSVGNAELRDSSALSVIGRSVNSIGDPADIASSADFEVLQRTGTTLAFGALRIENRTSDPGAPSTGQIWLRTDL